MYKLKSRCVTYTCIILLLFSTLTTELHVIAVRSDTATDSSHCVSTVHLGKVLQIVLTVIICSDKVLKYYERKFPGVRYYGVVDLLITFRHNSFHYICNTVCFNADFMCNFFVKISV
jgi:hypothetical protein